MARRDAVLLAAGAGVAVVLAWEAVHRTARLPPHLLPSPGSVAGAAIAQWPTLASHAWTTTYETLVGFGLAVVGGVASAVLLHSFPRLAMVLWPSILVAQITPKVAVAPLLLVWLGFGILPKMIIAFLISFFPILANTHAGLRSLDDETAELARSMRAGRAAFFLHFELPHALPYVFSGARIAITFAIAGTIVAEFVGSDRGLGYLILLTNRLLDPSLMFSSLIVLAAIGAALYGAVGLAERLAIPWHASHRRSIRALAESRRVAGSL